jgi:hypothetical protein
MKYNLSVRVTILILLIFASTTGCATIFSGSKQTIVFTSNVSNVEVRVDGELRGKTPFAVALKPGYRAHEVTFTKVGYQPQTLSMPTRFNLLSLLSGLVTAVALQNVYQQSGNLSSQFKYERENAFGNIIASLFWGLGASGVDLATGAVTRFQRSEYNILMVPLAAKPTPMPLVQPDSTKR